MKRDQAGRDLCARCNAVLSEAGNANIRLFFASFPVELERFHLLVLGGADFLRCPVCAAMIAAPSPALCDISPAGRVLLYLPPGTAFGDELEAQCRELSCENGRPESSIEVFHDSLRFRQKACHHVARGIVGLLNEVGTIPRAQLAAWAKTNSERITFEFLAGVWLLGQPGVPVNIHMAAWERGTPSPPPEEMARTGVKEVPHATRLSPDDAQRMMRERLEELAYIRLCRLIDDLLKTRDLEPMPRRLRDLIPAPIVTASLAARILDFAKEFGRHDGLAHYVAMALYADLLQLGGIPGRSPEWTMAFLRFEHHARTSGEGLQRLRVPREFAAPTVDPRTLWDVAARLASQLNDATGEGNPGVPSLISTLSGLVDELGFSREFNRYMAERVHVDLGEVSEERLDGTLDAIADAIRANPAQLHLAYPSLQRSLAKRDRLRLRAFMRRLRQDALKAGRDDDAIWLTARFSELSNHQRLGETALAEVEECLQLLHAGGRWEGAPVSARAMLLTEQGNALRYQGELGRALEVYNRIRSILPEDRGSGNFRVNERNRAIVLRDLGHVGEAIALFNSILPEADQSDRPEIWHSIAMCHAVAGRLPEAVDSLRQALKAIADEGRQDSSVELNIVLTLASVAIRLPDHGSAFDWAERAVGLTEETGNIFARATAMILRANAAIHLPGKQADLPGLVEEALREMQCPTMEEWIETADPSEVLRLAQPASILLWNIGRPGDAEKILSNAVEAASSDYTNQIWIVWLTLAQLAMAQGNVALARQRLAVAQEIVMRQAGRIARTDDLFAYMSGMDALQDSLSQLIVDAYRRGDASILDVCQIADFQASVVLSQRILASGGSSPAAGSKDTSESGGRVEDSAEAEGLRVLLEGGAPIGILQFFKAGGKVLALTARAAGADSPPDRDVPDDFSIVLLHWEEPLDEVVALADEAWNQLARTSPATRVNPLEGIGAWQGFAGRLRESVARVVPVGSHLVIIPGALSVAPLQDVFARQYSISYAPSLRAAAALHRRRLGMNGGGPQWRPRGIHDFVIWKADESPSNIALFKGAAEGLREAVQAMGCAYAASIGTDATRASLREALAGSEALRLSCHGRADPRSLRFDLLVAADGFLPPGHPTVLAEQLGERFLVGWQELSTLEKAPPVVFSAACGSGLASTVAGGERVGLERSLLRAGTLAYVAPQWPVPIADIQPMMNKIIFAYLANPRLDLSRVVSKVAADSIAEGMSERVALSVAVHGDWL